MRCTSANETPRGLQIGVQCHTFLKEETPVQAQFKETISSAEESLTQALTNHYKILQDKFKEEISGLEKDIQNTLAETK